MMIIVIVISFLSTLFVILGYNDSKKKKKGKREPLEKKGEKNFHRLFFT